MDRSRKRGIIEVRETSPRERVYADRPCARDSVAPPGGLGAASASDAVGR